MQPSLSDVPWTATSAGRMPARARMAARTLLPDGARCRTTATAAGRSSGSARTIVVRASTPPAEAPMTISERGSDAGAICPGNYADPEPMARAALPARAIGSRSAGALGAADDVGGHGADDVVPARVKAGQPHLVGAALALHGALADRLAAVAQRHDDL